MKKIKCISVGGKLRMVSTDPNVEGFVAFPRDLRVEGKTYQVDELMWMGNYWKAVGNIIPLSNPVYKARKKAIVKTLYGEIMYDYTNDYYFLNEFINILKDFGCKITNHYIDLNKRHIEFSYKGTLYNKKHLYMNITNALADNRDYIKKFLYRNIGQYTIYM